MLRKALLHSSAFLAMAMLAACGGGVTPSAATPTPAPYGGASGSSGSMLIVWLAAVTLVILVVLSISRLRRKKDGTEDSTSAADKIKSTDRPSGSRPKPLPAKHPAGAKSAAPKVVSTSGYIFISYRRSDTADIAGRIYDRLTGSFGRNPIFKDVDSIPLGLDFKEYLDAKVSECSVLLAVIGDRWLEARDEAGKERLNDPADFVRIEIESALARGIPVIPLLVRGARMPSEKNLPGSLKKLVYRNGIPIRSDPDFHRDMDRLIAALEKYIQ